jgi:hypothetical protein
MWRRVILEQPDLWSHIVVVNNTLPDPALLAEARQQPARWPDAPFAALKFMHEGALPVSARMVADIPDTAWVKRMAVGESDPSSFGLSEPVQAVLTHSFPNLEQLIIVSAGTRSFSGLDGGLAAAIASWVSGLIGSLRHLYMKQMILCIRCQSLT